MRKTDNVEKICLAIIFCAAFVPTFFLLKIFNHQAPNYDLTDFSKASEEEKEALSIFYDSDMISEGKYFDLKFTYFEPCTDEAVMEIVKKTDADLGEVVIETWDENDEFISVRSYGRFEGESLFWDWRNDQRYLRYLFGQDFLDDHDMEINYTDDIFIKVTLWYDDGGEETHLVHFNLEKNFQELERHKENFMTSTYGGQLASYYYGLLLSYNKDRWFREVKELIENGKNEYLDYSRILKTNFAISISIRSGKYQDIQSLYQFNDEEYAEYQRMVQQAKDKGFFD